MSNNNLSLLLGGEKNRDPNKYAAARLATAAMRHSILICKSLRTFLNVLLFLLVSSRLNCIKLNSSSRTATWYCIRRNTNHCRVVLLMSTTHAAYQHLKYTKPISLYFYKNHMKCYMILKSDCVLYVALFKG